MTVAVHRSETCRHFVLRISAGDIVPDAVAAALRDEGVACGWVRGSGVLGDVELRAYDAELGTLGSLRRVAGPVQAVTIEGTVGVTGGETSLSLRVVLAREADRGLETIAGEIGSARAVALELLVTAFDDLALGRALDERAGVWLLGGASPSGGAAAPGPPAGASAHRRTPSAVRPPMRPPTPDGWSAALEASDRAEREPPARGSPSGGSAGGGGIPARPPRASPDLDAPFPEAGDSVDHFAFGRCDVLKSDGDRLHLKVHKDGRIREIALGMLRVTRLPDSEDGRRRFRLERRM